MEITSCNHINIFRVFQEILNLDWTCLIRSLARSQLTYLSSSPHIKLSLWIKQSWMMGSTLNHFNFRWTIISITEINDFIWLVLWFISPQSQCSKLSITPTIHLPHLCNNQSMWMATSYLVNHKSFIKQLMYQYRLIKAFTQWIFSSNS